MDSSCSALACEESLNVPLSFDRSVCRSFSPTAALAISLCLLALTKAPLLVFPSLFSRRVGGWVWFCRGRGGWRDWAALVMRECVRWCERGRVYGRHRHCSCCSCSEIPLLSCRRSQGRVFLGELLPVLARWVSQALLLSLSSPFPSASTARTPCDCQADSLCPLSKFPFVSCSTLCFYSYYY